MKKSSADKWMYRFDRISVWVFFILLSCPVIWYGMTESIAQAMGCLGVAIVLWMTYCHVFEFHFDKQRKCEARELDRLQQRNRLCEAGRRTMSIQERRNDINAESDTVMRCHRLAQYMDGIKKINYWSKLIAAVTTVVYFVCK